MHTDLSSPSDVHVIYWSIYWLTYWPTEWPMMSIINLKEALHCPQACTPTNSNQSKSHHSELDALVSCLRVTTSSCLRLSEFYVETVTHMLQPPVSCWMMCVSPFLYFAQGCPCFPARYIKKKNSHKGRNFFLGELMSTALQGGRSHFGEAGLSLYSLLPRI